MGDAIPLHRGRIVTPVRPLPEFDETFNVVGDSDPGQLFYSACTVMYRDRLVIRSKYGRGEAARQNPGESAGSPYVPVIWRLIRDRSSDQGCNCCRSRCDDGSWMRSMPVNPSERRSRTPA